MYDNKQLCIAVKNNDLQGVKLLLEDGADIHVDNDYPLRIACNSGNLKLVKFLIKSGANMKVIPRVNLKSIKNGMLHTFKFGKLLEVGHPNGHVEIVIPNEDFEKKDHHVMDIIDPPPMYNVFSKAIQKTISIDDKIVKKNNYKKKIVLVMGIIVWTFLISYGGYTIGYNQE